MCSCGALPSGEPAREPARLPRGREVVRRVAHPLVVAEPSFDTCRTLAVGEGPRLRIGDHVHRVLVVYGHSRLQTTSKSTRATATATNASFAFIPPSRSSG